jgi:phage gpG-like protein
MAGVSDFIAKLEKLAGAEVQDAIANKVATAAHEECLRGFIEQRDPYGVAWAPRKGRGNWNLLDKTGKGLNSLTADVSRGSARLKIVGYFRFHQSGTSRMVARKIFPDEARGLGTWAEPVRAASVDAVRELVNGR